MLKVFWGASKAGRFCLNLWKAAGCCPDFFTCNDSRLFGKYVCGVSVIAPEEIIYRKDVIFYITSSSYYEICHQLLDKGITADRIIVLDISSVSSIPEIYLSLEQKYIAKRTAQTNKIKGVIIENIYGDALSGEQTWVRTLQKELIKNDIPCEILTPSDNLSKNDSSLVSLERSDHSNLFYSACDYFLSCRFNSLVVRGGSEIFAAACFVKRKYHLNLNIFVFSHKDFLNNYLDFCLLKNEINALFAISYKIKKTFVSLGFPSNKLVYYPWMPKKVSSIESLKFNSDNPIKLVYLGRLVVSQKRCDLLLRLALLLQKSNVNFKLYIGGEGESSELLKKFVHENKLNEKVIFCGLIDRDEVAGFLHNKDVFVSCSEAEGHSLSQFEALSQGLAAVVTDCSGVSDDIIDGINGFICPQHNLEKMCEAISMLDDDRTLLFKMRQNSIKIFQQKLVTYQNPLIELIKFL